MTPMRPEQREHYMDGFKEALQQHQQTIQGRMFGTASWLYCEAGNIYVRPHGLHNIPDVGGFTAYDFANLTVNEFLRGHGILTDVIEWWHTQHDQQITYIENVSNAKFAESLRKRGWSEVNQWGVPCFYKLR